MKINRIYCLLFTAFLACKTNAQEIVKGTEASIFSPDKKLKVQFYQKSFGTGKREMFYQVSYNGKQVINESELDLQLDNNLSERAMALKVDKHAKWFENLEIKNISTSTKDTSWKPVVGEK